MRNVMNINNDWLYREKFEPHHISPVCNEADFEQVQLPHANKETPYNYFDEKMYQFVSCYRKHIFLGRGYQGKRLFIDFEGVMTYAKCYFNGEMVGEHKGGYTPFSIEITKFIRYGEDNVLTVMVDSTEREDIPPFGDTIDYLCYGGIYREVSLRVVENDYISNVFLDTNDVLGDQKSMSADIHLETQEPSLYQVMIQLCDCDCQVLETLNIDHISECRFQARLEDLDVDLWGLDRPVQYKVEVMLKKQDELVDVVEFKVGFRHAEFRPDGFYLNGRHINLVGLNRHQSFPYVGYAMPKRAQEKDADILKDLGINIVRTSHYPQSKHFLNRCDQIGLLVLEEIPGWQYIGDAGWKDIAVENVKEMIERDYNHPSIIMWGVRINESQDDHEFYTRTNKLAHDLDKTRQTGGIRYLTHSQLLEDVYTMNDFDYHQLDQKKVTGLDDYVPYLVTEKVGHIYPTKRFDQEQRLVEHATRHLSAHNETFLDDYISGLICWCAFDYNTHHNFGSGDRICYHGVTDMFRIPKLAAYGYKSMKDPSDEIVMEPGTIWAQGERDGCGINPLEIYTNCDAVQLFIDGSYVDTFMPNDKRYKGLKHPPILIEKDFSSWGGHWSNARFVGVIKDQAVIEKAYVKDPVATSLIGSVDDLELNSGDWDVTRLTYKIVDQIGNITPFINETIQLEVEGPGEIIGPKHMALIGGCIGSWVKTTGQAGLIRIKAKCTRFEAEIIEILVK